MAFKKGNKLAKGRIKGSKNKAPERIKEAFSKLVDDNLDNISEWLKRVAATSPKDALELLNKFAQYTVPQVQRTEVKDVTNKSNRTLIIDWTGTQIPNTDTEAKGSSDDSQ